MTLDFTLEKYDELCRTIRQLHCPVMAVKAFLEAGQPEGFMIVLRHDVDRRMRAALRMAELEARYGIAATYYVRATPNVFKPEALGRLCQFGHEVGYHYEVLARAAGDAGDALTLFQQDLARFRRIVAVDTISMHGSPLSPWNNLDLWQTYDVAEYGILGDAVLSIDSEDLYYFTDTGRSWDVNRYNLRDRVASRLPQRRVQTTDDLIGFLQERPVYPIYISAHPNRWAVNYLEWGAGALSDWAVNRAKWALSLMRSWRS